MKEVVIVKSKIIFLGILVICITLSGYVGYFLGYHRSQKKSGYAYSQLLYQASADELLEKIVLLKNMQKGDANKVEKMLETMLDSNLAYLSLYEEIKPSERSEKVLTALLTAKKYREGSSHKVKPEYAESVRKAFELAQW